MHCSFSSRKQIPGLRVLRWITVDQALFLCCPEIAHDVVPERAAEFLEIKAESGSNGRLRLQL